MKRRRNRHLSRQRAALAVIAVLLIALGGAGLLLATGTVDQLTTWAVSEQPLVNSELDRSVAADQTVYQAGLLAAGVVIFALGAVWLRFQLPARRHHQDQQFSNDARADDHIDGVNIVRGGALAAALEEDLERRPEVERAVAEFRAEEAVIRLRMTTADSFALSELRSDVVGPAVERAATVGELAESPTVEIDVRFAEHSRTVA